MKCIGCGRELTRDEIAITKKLVNRGCEEFFCVDCLAREFRITAEDVRALIARFRAAGCTLFE